MMKSLASVVMTLAGFFLFAGIGHAQTAVSGTVADESGEPLIGASVFVEGNATVGTITDLDGKYSLTVPEGSTALVFSFIGMKDQVEQINGRSVVNAVLVAEFDALEATVVTAMGITKSEKSLSYNVQETKLENVTPTGSFVNSLNGKVAGVNISQSSTGIGGGSRVVMRGTKSISGNNNALYVIDGIPMPSLAGEQPEGVFAGAGQTGDGLAAINPDDIESISVLSGPSAAALYGSSAANGVVIITTKKGSKDQFSLNYSNNTSFSNAYVMPKFQNTYGTTEAGSYQSWGDKLATPSSWNPRNFFQTGYNTTNSISLSTGNEKNQTYLSMASTNAEGIIRNNDFDRYNFSIRNTSNFLNDKLTLDLSANYTFINEKNMVAQGQYMNPVLPVYLFPAGGDWNMIEIYERYNAERNMKTQFWPYEHDLSMQNPYWITERQLYQNRKNRLMSSAQLKYEIAPWINISGRAKIDKTNELQEKKFNASTITLFSSDAGYYSHNALSTTQVFAEALVNINKYFLEDRLSLTALLGANIEHVRYAQDLVEGNLALVPNLFTFANIDRNHSGTSLSQRGYDKQKQSIFANVQLGWRGMVYLDVTARNDWSSTFAGSNYGSFFYPTVGLSGILTEIFPSLKGDFLNYWKVRASYSEVGNDPELFLTIPTKEVTNGQMNLRGRMDNTDLQPERTKSYEIGTNLYFFNNRLKLDATAYASQTYHQFFEPSLPPSSLYSSVILNAGRVDNMGVELSASWTQEFASGFNWRTYMTYSHNRNIIREVLKEWFDPETNTYMSLPNFEKGGLGGVKTILEEGGSMSDIYVTSLNVDEHGAIYVHPTDQTVSTDYRYIYAGDTAPKHLLSWGNEFSYKGFNLNFLFNARIGGVAVSKTQAVMDFYGISQDTADARDNGGALVNGKRIPAVSYYQTIGGGDGVLSQYVYDATNIRLAELSLGYNFPVQNWCKWLKGLNVSFVGHNLAMLLLRAPFDPEMTATTGTYNQGIDYFMQPSTRNLGFSVKLKF